MTTTTPTGLKEATKPEKAWFYEYYFDSPTPGELASHLNDAIHFVRAHPESCESRAILIYSWNENDEGGWLTPTLDKDGAIDDGRLRAIKAVIMPQVSF